MFMTKPRVVIADDHRLVAEALEQLLADDCDVVGTVYDGEALLKLTDTPTIGGICKDTECRGCRP